GLGPILARLRGATNPKTGLPTYVRIGHIYGDGPAWLGPSFSPFDSSGNSRNNMNLHVALERLTDRRSLLKAFDKLDRNIDRSGLAYGLDSFEGQAFYLILCLARPGFYIYPQDPRTRATYR